MANVIPAKKIQVILTVQGTVDLSDPVPKPGAQHIEKRKTFSKVRLRQKKWKHLLIRIRWYYKWYHDAQLSANTEHYKAVADPEKLVFRPRYRFEVSLKWGSAGIITGAGIGLTTYTNYVWNPATWPMAQAVATGNI